MTAFITCPALSGLPGIRHGFFTRQGGVSSGIFASLNCGPGSNDDLAKVGQNRARVAEALSGKPEMLCTAHQVHSNKALIIEKPWAPGEAPQVDALVTKTPGIILGVLTADCLPILLADEKARVIAAAHAGWKGAFSGIIEAAIEAMESLGAARARMLAAIGPGIGQASYEVDAAFRERFLADDAHNEQFFIAGARSGHFLFDLPAYGKERLRDAGVSHINILARDTCFEEDTFFSYRRSCLRKEPGYGRQISAITLLSS